MSLKSFEKYHVNSLTIHASRISNEKHAGNTDADAGDQIIHTYMQLQLIVIKHLQRQLFIHTKRIRAECTTYPIS